MERRTSRLGIFLAAFAGIAGVVLCGALMFDAWGARAHDVEAHPLKTANPTSATFDASDAEVRACADQSKGARLDIDAAKGTRIFFQDSHMDRRYSFDDVVFNDPANARDVVLHTTVTSNPLSDVYSIGGKPLTYTIDLHVHIVPTSASKTSVDVRALRYQVITGTKLAIGHAWMHYVYRDVPPTTIDEYRVLEKIATCLGKDALPQVVTP